LSASIASSLSPTLLEKYLTGTSPLRIIGGPSEGEDGCRKERERASHHERHDVRMAFVLDRTQSLPTTENSVNAKFAETFFPDVG
jgi:hypothetical protein